MALTHLLVEQIEKFQWQCLKLSTAKVLSPSDPTWHVSGGVHKRNLKIVNFCIAVWEESVSQCVLI